MVFYIAFFIQAILILLTSKKDLSANVLKLSVWLVVLCPVLVFLMHLMMRNIEVQHFAINKLRTETLATKERNNTVYKSQGSVGSMPVYLQNNTNY